MISCWIEIKNINEYSEIMNFCKKLNLLGSNILIGTSFADNYIIDDIINFYDEGMIAGISVSDGESNINYTKYKECFGINKILVSLVTFEDVRKGDISSVKYLSLKDFIKNEKDIVCLVRKRVLNLILDENNLYKR